MGVELIERVKQCEEMTKGALAAIDEMKQTAARYRTEAKRVFYEIEDCSLIAAEVRNICNELIEKIVTPATTQKSKKVKSTPASDSASSLPMFVARAPVLGILSFTSRKPRLAFMRPNAATSSRLSSTFVSRWITVGWLRSGRGFEVFGQNRLPTPSMTKSRSVSR